MSDGTHPTGTYRLQLRPEFGFAEAGAAADYLAMLGVSHVYLSPVFQAVPGSPHRYDVVDHTQISTDLGGEAPFRAMAGRFRDHGLAVLVDVVPNHMAIPAPESLNQALWSVLREGRSSPYAPWFDIDWEAGDGRLLLPVLAKRFEESRAELVEDQPAGVLRYHDHVYPLGGCYELVWWREALAGRAPNYRRFFDVSTLIGLRVEDPDVFAATHARLLDLYAEGLVDGLRIDHPDGLADPRGYLIRLADRTAATTDTSGGAWTVAEKILVGDEELPADWPCAGTTGYDALGMVGGLFVDPAGERPLTDLYTALTGGPGTFEPVERAAKRHVAERVLRPEVGRLERLLQRALPDADAAALHAASVELLVAMPVYRAYIVPGEEPPPQARAIIAAARARADLEVMALSAATDRAITSRSAEELLDRVVALVLGEGAGPLFDEIVVRFQQTSAPLMAKGVEDTAFYRWSRLVSLNEVGGDPARFAVRPEEFHAYAARIAGDWPLTLTTLSTHDTKRQEDVRARLAVLAELPAQWAEAVTRWRARVPGSPAEPDLDYLMWQTMVAAWPITSERLRGYLTKAMREAKTRSSWTDPDGPYENAVLAHADHVLETCGHDIAAFARRIAPYARVNSLGQKLLQLTMPGVADVYQGCELTGLSLVDPDNRRPVDYGLRRNLLAKLDDGHAPGNLDEEKLLVTSRALRLRRRHPEWFVPQPSGPAPAAASYEPLTARGPAADHMVAFRRVGAITVATRLPAGLERRGGWGDTALALPDGSWRDVLTGRSHSGAPLLAELLHRLPVALLCREDNPA